MGVGQFSVAAATAVVGYDLAQQTIWQQQMNHRVLTGFGLCGSAAGGDTKVSIYVDSVKVAEFFNVTTGFPTRDHVAPFTAVVPAGGQIHIYVDDAPGTNPINGILTWDDI